MDFPVVKWWLHGKQICVTEKNNQTASAETTAHQISTTLNLFMGLGRQYPQCKKIEILVPLTWESWRENTSTHKPVIELYKISYN